MNNNKLEDYIAYLDESGRDFSVHFERFTKLMGDPGSLNFGGAADSSLAQAIASANKFATCLNLISEDRPTFFTSASVRANREKVISHSRANLARMNELINSVPESLRKGAEIAVVMSALRGR
jgi:hypothetical protein